MALKGLKTEFGESNNYDLVIITDDNITIIYLLIERKGIKNGFFRTDN